MDDDLPRRAFQLAYDRAVQPRYVSELLLNGGVVRSQSLIVRPTGFAGPGCGSAGTGVCRGPVHDPAAAGHDARHGEGAEVRALHEAVSGRR